MQPSIPYVFYDAAVYYQFGEHPILFKKGNNNTYTARFGTDEPSQLCAQAFGQFIQNRVGGSIASGGSWECYWCEEACTQDYPPPIINEITLTYRQLCKLYEIRQF
jgi:hypothetical protein